MTTNRLRDEMDMELGREQWEDFCREEFGDHQGPSDPAAMYKPIKVCDGATTIQKALDIVISLGGSVQTPQRQMMNNTLVHCTSWQLVGVPAASFSDFRKRWNDVDGRRSL